MDFSPMRQFEMHPRLYKNLLFARLVLFKERMQRLHDGIGVGEVVHVALLLVELHQRLIVGVFRYIILSHQDIFHIRVGDHLPVGLRAIVLCHNFRQLPFLPFQAPEVIEGRKNSLECAHGARCSFGSLFNFIGIQTC